MDNNTEPEQGGDFEDWEPLSTSEHMEITPEEKMLDELLKGYRPEPNSGTPTSNGTVKNWEIIPDEDSISLHSGPISRLGNTWRRLIWGPDKNES